MHHDQVTPLRFEALDFRITRDVRLDGACAQVAFTDAGKPSKALLGFCKKNGLDADNVEVEADRKGVEYVWGIAHQKGLPAAEVSWNQRHLPVSIASRCH